jgi:starvation-inducible DNA-binding protein
MTASLSTPPSESIRRRSGELLRRHLAAAVDLRRQIEEAQRNMSPECRIPIRELLAQVAEAVGDYSETIAERRAALGAAKETGEAAVRGPSLRHEVEIADDVAQVAAVAAALAAFGDSTRKAIDMAAAFGDADTSGAFIELSRGIDYHLWLVESHLSRSTALRYRDDRQIGPVPRASTRDEMCSIRALSPLQFGTGGA